jgi:hypothetical protein
MVLEGFIRGVDLDHHELTGLVNYIVHGVGDYSGFPPRSLCDFLKANLESLFLTGFGNSQRHYNSVSA